METVQIIRQYRFIDPDKAFAQDHGGLSKSGKWVFNWDTTEIDDNTDKESGYILPGEYILTCKNTNATKAVEVADLELVTTEEEARVELGSLQGEQLVSAVRYLKENREKERISAGLMERHESPEKAAKRLEKKTAKASQELMDWAMSQVSKGGWPSQDDFNAQLRVVYGKFDLELPNQE